MTNAPAASQVTTLERSGQGADPENERKRERDRAIGADAAVAHDLELLRPGRAAAETVGRVGEAVFVQSAGCGNERRRREPSADEPRQAQNLRRREDGGGDEADDRARDRRRPGDAVHVEAPLVALWNRQPGEEPQRIGDVARRGRKASVRAQSAHRNMATAATPIAAKPNSMNPHWRTSARAAETSPPFSDRI